MTVPRLLVIMGSGETSPTMVKTHRQLFARLGPPPVPAVLLDTPFGFQENASEVAGRAQILVVPDLEAGNMLAKNLSYFANADGAGIVLGARVPIVLTSRADSPRARLASCAVATLYADARRRHYQTAAA